MQEFARRKKATGELEYDVGGVITTEVHKCEMRNTAGTEGTTLFFLFEKSEIDEREGLVTEMVCKVY